MTFLEPIKSFLNKTDSKTFSYYMIGYVTGCVLLSILMIFYYYRSIGTLQRKIKNINSSREEVLTILEKASSVQQQRSMVEETLAKDMDFKIGGYFKNLLVTLNLKDKEVAEETSTADLEENYRKSELSAKFEDMSMRDLTELLQEIEKNSRIATNRLEITQSKKKPKTVEVSLTISTLLPKIESTTT